MASVTFPAAIDMLLMASSAVPAATSFKIAFMLSSLVSGRLRIAPACLAVDVCLSTDWI